MRQFVRSHPKYQKDSVVSHAVAYDLLVACDEIVHGVRKAPEILGDYEFEVPRSRGSAGKAGGEGE